MSRDEFLAGPDEDGIDALDLEIESLEIWLETARDRRYRIEEVNGPPMSWRDVATQLAERALRLARLLKEQR